MKIRTLYIPVFLLVLLVFSGLTWSTVDSQVMADSGYGGDDAVVNGLFSGKAPLIAALALVALFLLNARNPLRSLGASLCAFFCLAAASVVWASNPGTVAFALANLFLLLAGTMIAHTLLGFERALRLIWLLSTALILVSIALAAIGDPHALMGGLHAGRWRGVFPHKNTFGPFLAVNLLISLFAQRSLRLPAPIVYPMVAVDLVTLVFANSATADLAVVAGMAAGIAMLPIPNRGLRTLWRIMTVGGACFAGAVLLLQPNLVGDLLGRDTSMSGRSELWAQAMPLTMQHRLGTGYGTAGGSQVTVEMQKRMHRDTDVGVQSGYINLALELGWVAVGLYLLWAGRGVVSVVFSREASVPQTLLVALLVADLVESISEVNGCFAPSWLLLVTMLPMVHVRRERPPRFRLARRRYTSVAPNLAPRAPAELPAR